MCVCVYVCVIMKTVCSPSYHHNGFVATHALGHIIYFYTLLVPMNQSKECSTSYARSMI